MDALIKKIYDMLYSPIITPYNVLENAKLDNYSYVKYYTNKIGLIAEMQCVIPGEGERVFFYQFDKKDFLQIIYEGAIEKSNIIFSREEAIMSAKEAYYSSKPISEDVC